MAPGRSFEQFMQDSDEEEGDASRAGPEIVLTTPEGGKERLGGLEPGKGAGIRPTSAGGGSKAKAKAPSDGHQHSMTNIGPVEGLVHTGGSTSTSRRRDDSDRGQHSMTSIGPVEGLRNRSVSPRPGGKRSDHSDSQQHSMTSLGPVDGLSKRSKSPGRKRHDADRHQHSMTSVGPGEGLSALGAGGGMPASLRPKGDVDGYHQRTHSPGPVEGLRGRSPSPIPSSRSISPMPVEQSMTSIGPGLSALGAGGVKPRPSSAKRREDPEGHRHSNMDEINDKKEKKEKKHRKRVEEPVELDLSFGSHAEPEDKGSDSLDRPAQKERKSKKDKKDKCVEDSLGTESSFGSHADLQGTSRGRVSRDSPVPKERKSKKDKKEKHMRDSLGTESSFGTHSELQGGSNRFGEPLHKWSSEGLGAAAPKERRSKKDKKDRHMEEPVDRESSFGSVQGGPSRSGEPSESRDLDSLSEPGRRCMSTEQSFEESMDSLAGQTTMTSSLHLEKRKKDTAKRKGKEKTSKTDATNMRVLDGGQGPGGAGCPEAEAGDEGVTDIIARLAGSSQGSDGGANSSSVIAPTRAGGAVGQDGAALQQTTPTYSKKDLAVAKEQVALQADDVGTSIAAESAEEVMPSRLQDPEALRGIARIVDLPVKGAIVVRFLLRFEPPTLAVEWVSRAGKSGDGGVITIPLCEQHLRGKAEVHKLAAQLVEERSDLLRSVNLAQVESLLFQLAAGVPPVYRVTAADGAAWVPKLPVAQAGAAWSAWSPPPPRARLPAGALILARTRSLRPDGWWINVAASGGWIREGAGASVALELWKPSRKEARAWLEGAQKENLDRGGPLAKSKKAVVEQLARCLDRPSVTAAARR